MQNNIIATCTYSPEFEADRLRSMFPRARHEAMLEEHQQVKSRRRENHRRGLHKLRFSLQTLP